MISMLLWWAVILGLVEIPEAPEASAGTAPAEAERVADDELAEAYEQARALHDGQLWWEAEAAWRELVRLDPGSAEAWHKLGYSLHRQERWSQAAEAHFQAVTLAGAEQQELRLRAHYDRACCFAHLLREDDAMLELRRAVQAGLRNPEYAEADPDLHLLHGREDFAELMDGIRQHRRNVAIVLYDGVQLLDVASAASVFESAILPGQGRQFEVYTVAADRQPRKAQGLVELIPENVFTDCPPPDIVIVPGGILAHARWDEVPEWLVQQSNSAQRIIALGSAPLLLQDAGLTAGRKLTLHPDAALQLEREGGSAMLAPDAAVVQSGCILTARGGSTGMLAALHVVGELLGVEARQHTAQHLQYADDASAVSVEDPVLPGFVKDTEPGAADRSR